VGRAVFAVYAHLVQLICEAKRINRNPIRLLWLYVVLRSQSILCAFVSPDGARRWRPLASHLAPGDRLSD
jgi:hypothetical protein